jgi:hypothetical protein
LLEDRIEVIQEIEFAFEPIYRAALNGKTVDLVNGKILVIPNDESLPGLPPIPKTLP